MISSWFIGFIFFLNIVLYSAYCYISYSVQFKEKIWFVPLLLFLSLSANFLWILIVKMTKNNDEVFFYGLVWDFLMYLPFILIPIFLFNINLNAMKILGLCLILIGTIIFKING